MFTYALQGADTPQADGTEQDTGVLGAAGFSALHTAENIGRGYMDVAATGLFGSKIKQQDLQQQQSSGAGSPLTWHGVDPSKVLSKDDYNTDYATPDGYHDGMTEGEATVAKDKYDQAEYAQAAQDQHPIATVLGSMGGSLADPLWYVPFADLLKYGVLATKLVDAEKVGKSLFDAGEWGERTIQSTSQVGLVTSGEEGVQDLEGKDPDVTNPLLAMVMGPAVGAISHAIGLPFEYRAAALKKAANDYMMNNPVDVTQVVRPIADHNIELEQAIHDPNPDKNIISTFMRGKVSPANARAGQISLDLLDGKDVSVENLKFFQAWKGGSKTLDSYFDDAIDTAKGEGSDKKITLYNSGTGNQEVWTSDKARAESYAAEGQPIKSKEFNADEVAVHNTQPGSPAAKAALNAGHQPTSTDYYFGDDREVMKAALESQHTTPEVQALKDAKEGQHLQSANNTPLEDTHETITLESKEPFLEDGKPMDPNQVADAKATEVSDETKELHEQLKANQSAETSAKVDKETGKVDKETPGAEVTEPPIELPDYVRRTLEEGNEASANLRSKALGLLRALTCRSA